MSKMELETLSMARVKKLLETASDGILKDNGSLEKLTVENNPLGLAYYAIREASEWIEAMMDDRE